MSKYSFLDDYSEGCHPQILESLAQSNKVQQIAYGDDEYSKQARELINAQMGDVDPAVYFIAGGTLTNIIIIASCLRPHEAVIAADSGHIVVRETGAIEATGHKIITVPCEQGKLTPLSIRKALESNAHFPHMAKPRLVYISNATELGTLYTKAELTALSQICKASGLLLFVDGARLGAALTAQSNDVTLKDLAELTDVFWIGGTKAGALLGEAVVIPNKALATDFPFHIKQRGALMAKGRVLGIQFLELFRDGLFFEASKGANELAQKLSEGIIKAGHSLAATTQTNQVFPILPNTLIDTLKEDFEFYVWEKFDDEHFVTRLVTSWATEEDQVKAFLIKVQEQG